MRKPHDTELVGLMEQIISNGAEDMGSLFAGLFDLAMRLEREQFLDAGYYERSAGRRGYANGYKTKKLDTPGGDVGGGGDVRQSHLDPRCRGCDERVWH